MPEVKNVKIDLSQLKQNIANSKQTQQTKQVALGNVPEGAIAKGSKKSFINELVTSMQSGRKTPAIEAIKAVNETVEVRRGVPQAVAKNQNRSYAPPRRMQMNEQQYQQPQQPQQRTGASDWGFAGGSGGPQPQYRGGMGEEREMMFEQDFSKANAAFDQRMLQQNPVVASNPQLMQQYQQQPHYAQQPQYVVEQPQQINEHMEVLNEKMEKNLEKMVESTFKSVLTNIYTKQKIQESLGEFLESEDFVKVVGRAINEIAKRNKAKQGK